MARQKKFDLEHMTEKEKMKYEIAGELGLLERVLNDGWRSLTAKETGRIGGLVTRRKRQMAAERKRRKISGTAIFAISSTVLTIDFSCESVIIKTRNGWCRAKVRVCTRPGDCRDTLRNSQSVFRIVWRSEGKVYGSKKREKVYVGYPSRGLYRTVRNGICHSGHDDI